MRTTCWSLRRITKAVSSSLPMTTAQGSARLAHVQVDVLGGRRGAAEVQPEHGHPARGAVGRHRVLVVGGDGHRAALGGDRPDLVRSGWRRRAPCPRGAPRPGRAATGAARAAARPSGVARLAPAIGGGRPARPGPAAARPVSSGSSSGAHPISAVDRQAARKTKLSIDSERGRENIEVISLSTPSSAASVPDILCSNYQ